MTKNTRGLILTALLALAVLPGSTLAQHLSAGKALEFPGMGSVLPRGVTAGDPDSSAGAVAVDAWMLPAKPPLEPLRVAVLLSQPSDVGRNSSLIVARQQGAGMTAELELKADASGASAVVLDHVGPGGAAVAAVHWSSPDGLDGRLVVWTLGPGAPVLALEAAGEGSYFDTREDGTHMLVVYEPDEQSTVRLPSVYEWQGSRLVRREQTPEQLMARLLGEYDEVLDSYEASNAGAAPNRMVMDVALSRARLLERAGKRAEALAAYERVKELGDALPAAGAIDAEERAALELRVAEGARRAGAIR